MMVLIEGCKHQDRESQRLLYKHYFNYAMGICTRYSASAEEAQEILNDGFMKIFTKIHMYDPDKSFMAWLKRIMINTAIDHFRANKKHNHTTNLEGHDKMQEAGAVDDLSHKELMVLVQSLTPMYRAVFCLFAIDGYTHENIAKKLGISVGTSKSNLSKARNNLKKMLRLTNKEVYEQYI